MKQTSIVSQQAAPHHAARDSGARRADASAPQSFQTLARSNLPSSRGNISLAFKSLRQNAKYVTLLLFNRAIIVFIYVE